MVSAGNSKAIKNQSKSQSKNEFPPGMAPKILNMLETIEKLETSLDPLVSKPQHEVYKKMNSLERSKIGMLEAYTINSLFWVLMKTSKEEVEAPLLDDYKIEMGRLKEIQKRIAEVEAREDRPQVNREAAARFITRGIGHNSKKRSKEQDKDKGGGKKWKKEKPENCETDAFKSAWQ